MQPSPSRYEDPVRLENSYTGQEIIIKALAYIADKPIKPGTTFHPHITTLTAQALEKK